VCVCARAVEVDVISHTMMVISSVNCVETALT
jgi:hypothetical protein